MNPQKTDRNLPSSVLSDPAIDDLPFSGKTVRLDGNAPVWMFANFALHAVRGGAAEVSVYQPQSGDTAVWRHKPVIKAGDAGSPVPEWCRLTGEKDSGGLQLEFLPAPAGGWTLADFEKTPLYFAGGTEMLIIGGRGANWMYAAAVVAAGNAGIAHILYDSPREESLISIGLQNPGVRLPRKNHVENSTVVGIVGDPNSGKSVLSRWLERAIKKEWPNSWRVDADAASPTPNWYLDMLRSNFRDDADGIRQAIKNDWSHELEERVKDHIRNARQCLKVILVDLPGGIHPKEKYRPSQRIPPGREVIMREIDLFVVLWKDETSLEGWREALREHGLENRIFAEIQSTDHTGAPFFETHREGPVIRGIVRGADRYNANYDSGPGTAELVRHIRVWPLAQEAKAAVSKAFLTGPGGVRYGAAVLCADGHIYTAGQYSSFNHSTNIHAEQGALLQAAMGGSFPVRVLALASTDASAVPRPCGVCRQVMMEHVSRTAMDFDVAMVGHDGRIEIETASGLLPFFWESHKSRKSGSASSRSGTPDFKTPSQDTAYRTGDCVIWKNGTAIGIVWESAFSPGLMLVKLKYEKDSGGNWIKLPHSLTESFEYMAALQDKEFFRETGFGPSACLVKKQEIEGISPGIIEDTRILPRGLLRLFTGAEMDISRLRFTASRAYGLQQPDSDFDLVMEATPEQIEAFRNEAKCMLDRGEAAIPRESGTWRLFGKVFPGGTDRVIGEKRFFESLELAGQKVSILFIRLCTQKEKRSLLYDPDEWEAAGRRTVCGVAAGASDAPFKRAGFSLVTPFHEEIEVASYCKLANLVKPGDHLSLGGWLLNSKTQKGVQRLVQILSGYDPIVWMR
ncbi:MAG: hypothetical protein LBP76_04550 [Treponema sp.]|nr:hypothetical protein [Treponema sp.]